MDPVTSGWRFVRVVTEGDELRIDGVDVWSTGWGKAEGSIDVLDPTYGQPHTLSIHRITKDGRTVVFAAGEFSNGVWAFYEPAGVSS